MELKINQSILQKLKEDGYDVEEMVKRITEELMGYDFGGSSLFDLFFDYNGERTHAQGKVKNGIAHCYGVGTNLKIIKAKK